MKSAILIALVLWVLLSVGTATANPMESISRLLRQLDDLTGAARLTSSTTDSSGTVVESPEYLAGLAAMTLGQAVAVEEYALARMLRSERSASGRGGNDLEGAAILWVARNDAAANNGGDILQCLTGGYGFGKQGGRRKYSTARDPYDVDLRLVRSVLSGQVADLTGGATHFMHRTGFVLVSDYSDVVKKWTGRGWSRVDVDVGTSLEIWT